jgi:peptide-methionine (S)-S-oxide reductase
MQRSLLLVGLVALVACGQLLAGPEGDGKARYVVPAELEARVKSGELVDAVFAGGCFWCMEGPFEKLDGVVAAISGYSGGDVVDPIYEQVGTGRTGHAEAVRVIYDPKKVSFAALVAVFWKNIDPLQANGQFCDLGPEYRSALFYGNDAEKATAELTRDTVAEKLGKTLATEIVPRKPFYAAEAYHQDFYRTNPEHYHRYRAGCGRDDRLRELWGK